MTEVSKDRGGVSLPAFGSSPVNPAASPPGAAPAARNAGVWKAAQDFEAMAIGQLLQPMFETVDTSEGMFGGGSGEQSFRPMLVTEMAKAVEKHGGLGLAQPVYAQMLKMQEKRS